MESQPWSVHALLKDELLYEVEIRSDEPEDTAVALRKQLHELLDFAPAEAIIDTECEAEKEMLAVTTKVQLLEAELERYLKRKESHVLYRIKSLHWHLNNRVRRIKATDAEQATLKRVLEARVASVSRHIPQQAQLSISEQPKMADCSGERNVLKWNIKFNGKTDPRSFLEKIQDMQQATGITDEKLFCSSPLLFVDLGKIWFNGVKAQVNSWDELKAILLEEFSPQDYDYQLIQEIRCRRQGADEPVHLYFAMMSNMFDRLKRTLPEAEKLEILRHNIRKDYIMQLALVEVDTVFELKEKCRKIEGACHMKPHFSQFDLSNNQMSEPRQLQQQPRNIQQSDINRKSGSCFKCGLGNHDFSKCRFRTAGTQNVSQNQSKPDHIKRVGRTTQPIHCYGCGEVGFTKLNCVRCRTQSQSKNA